MLENYLKKMDTEKHLEWIFKEIKTRGKDSIITCFDEDYEKSLSCEILRGMGFNIYYEINGRIGGHYTIKHSDPINLNMNDLKYAYLRYIHRDAINEAGRKGIMNALVEVRSILEQCGQLHLYDEVEEKLLASIEE